MQYDRLAKLGLLPLLEGEATVRQLQGDVIEVFKIINRFDELRTLRTLDTSALV